jgi:hemoglobin
MYITTNPKMQADQIKSDLGCGSNRLKFHTMADTPSIYDLIGGGEALRSLVDRFYDLMDSAPEAAHIRVLHPASLQQSREKLYMFLSGWSGGPSLYVERFGHPRLRQRHMPFPIGVVERDEWLWCMQHALDDSQIPVATIEFLKSRFAEIADFMRNQQNE